MDRLPPSTYENSLASTKYSLSRGADIGALGVVIHTGSAVDVSHVPTAWKQIHDGMMPILEELSDDSPLLLLEPTAGQGQSLVKRLEDLTQYLEALEYHPKVAICLDTCHVFAAGHDIKVKGGMTETLDLLVSIVGLNAFNSYMQMTQWMYVERLKTATKILVKVKLELIHLKN